MAKYRNLRGVCDITEDGQGGFTMDSIYHGQLNGEKFVTSVFRLKSEVDAEGKSEWKAEWKGEGKGEGKAKESKEWNPKDFNFKAAFDGSPSKRKTTRKGTPGKIKEVHHSKKVGSRQNEKSKVSQVKKQLDEAFEDPHSDILKEVTNKIEEGGFDELEKCLQQDHGEDCKCGEYIKEVVDLYESQGISLLGHPEKENQNGNSEAKDKDQEIREEVPNGAEKQVNKEKNSKENQSKEEKASGEYDEDWVCKEYVRKVSEFYDSMDTPSLVSFEDMKRTDPKEEDKEKETNSKGAEEDNF